MKLGIPVDKTDSWRNYNQVLDSDNVNFIDQGVGKEEDDGLSSPEDEEDEENASSTVSVFLKLCC
jgi:hypothetical protein